MRTGEDEITRYFAGRRALSKKDFPIGIGDDMAEVRLGDSSVLITTDMLLDGVHFDLSQHSLEQVGYKAMAVSLSDCAAMATIPLAAVVAVALPVGFGQERLKQLHEGVVTAGDKFGCSLIGGDITRWSAQGRLAINVAMLSRPTAKGPIKRSGARVGDVVCVTGALGGSRFGRHLSFEPRVKEALRITEIVEPSSMIDISDGLSSDLNRICTSSGVGAMVRADLIPISEPARKTDDSLASALNDGEDFELLFTVSASEWKRLKDDWHGKTEITQIGEITDTGKMQIEYADGRVENLQPAGYDHFG